jgi:hypothetical protein
VSSTTYYPQRNGQAQSTKVLGTLLTKLVNENKTDWDEHLSTMLFSYKSTYKITTWYTSYQLVYGLHPLMPIEYIVLIAGGNKRNCTLVKLLTSRITKLEKLQEDKCKL